MPFIALEGIEGSGKSTQCRRLAAALGPGVVVTQEPGGTPIGRAVRDVLLDRRHSAMSAEAELLLYFADRAQHVKEVVRPALEAGRLVVSDRFVASTKAYQGFGRGLSMDAIDALWRIATGGLVADLNVLLDVPIEMGLARVRERGAVNRLEIEQREFYARVLGGYRKMVADDPEHWIVLSGAQPAEAVTDELLAAIESRGLLLGAHGAR